MNMYKKNNGSGATLLRVRVSVIGSDLEIWRLLELDTSLPLDRLHEVIQLAFGWRTSHLHAFTDIDPLIGLHEQNGSIGESRRWVTQDLLDDGLGSLLETEWTLGQVLTEESGPLFYEYDFGDGWVHRIEFIEVLPRLADDPSALLVCGERRGPLEDSGGIDGYGDLVKALADPAHEGHRDATEWVAETVGPWQVFDANAVDVDLINQKLQLLFVTPGNEGGRAGLVSLADELAQRMHTRLAPEFRSYLAAAGLDGVAQVDAATAEQMLRPYLWLVQRVGLDGLELTAAGWLPTAVVADAMCDLGYQRQWIGVSNRENQAMPVMRLRETAQRLGLVRKLKGRLVLGAAAKKVLDNPTGLWSVLASALTQRARSGIEGDAVLLLAVEVASGRRASRSDYLEPISFGLSGLGWTTRDGWNLSPEVVTELIADAWFILFELNVFVGDKRRYEITGVTEEGRAFARAVLQA